MRTRVDKARIAVTLLLLWLVTPFASGSASAAVKRGALGIGTVGAVVTISATNFTLAYTAGLQPLAVKLKANSLYFSADDAFPALAVSAYSPLSLPQNAIVLATVDTAGISGIQTRWSLNDAHVDALKQHDQGYLITMNAKNQILILGGSTAATQYGVVDFLENLTAHTALMAKWTSASVINWPDMPVRASNYVPGIGNSYQMFTRVDADTFATIAGCDYDTTCAAACVDGDDNDTDYYCGFGKWLDAMVKNKATMLKVPDDYAQYAANATFSGKFTAMLTYLKARHIKVPGQIVGFSWMRGHEDLLEGLGMIEVPMTIADDGHLVPAADDFAGYYDTAAEEPVSLLPYDDFESDDDDTLDEITCAGTGADLYESGCLYAGDYSYLSVTDGVLAVKPGGYLYAFFDRREEASSSWRFRPGRYYLLGFRVKHADAATSQAGYATVSYASANDKQIMWFSQPFNIPTTAGEWGWRNIIWRVPDDADGAVDMTEFTDKYLRIDNTGKGDLYFDDFRLFELNPLLLNVLANQGVVVTDCAGTSYTEGTDYTVDYGTLPAMDWGSDGGVFATDGSFNAETARISWSGATKPSKVCVTYSSRLPVSYGGATAWRYDVTLDAYYDHIVKPEADGVLDMYGDELPEWEYVMGYSEIRRIRMGADAGQREKSNAEYLGYFLGKVDDYLDGKRAGDTTKLRPLIFDDMLGPRNGTNEFYQLYYGGQWGAVADALSEMDVSDNPAIIAWSFNVCATDDCSAYTDCPSAEYRLYEYFKDKGYAIIGSPSRDGSGESSDIYFRHNAENWATLAASDPDFDLGLMDMEWNYADLDAALAHQDDALALGWNAEWGLLKYFKIDAEGLAAGDWSAGASALGEEYAHDCGTQISRDFAGLNLAADWVSSQVTLKLQWNRGIKLRFGAKTKSTTAVTAPTVTARFYNALGILISSSSGIATHKRGDTAATTLATDYYTFETDGITTPATAVAVAVTIVPATGTYLDDVILLQRTAQPGFP